MFTARGRVADRKHGGDTRTFDGDCFNGVTVVEKLVDLCVARSYIEMGPDAA